MDPVLTPGFGGALLLSGSLAESPFFVSSGLIAMEVILGHARAKIHPY